MYLSLPFSSTNLGVTITSFFSPSLLIKKLIGLSFARLIPIDKSSAEYTLLPLIFRNSSPSFRPDSIAGMFSIKPFILGMLYPNLFRKTVNSIIASKKFITAPAITTLILLSGDLEEKLLSSLTSSSSPIILTYPPIGNKPIEYLVSFPSVENILGPIPIENSSTLIPFTLAIIKCPSSCTIISKLNPSNA